MHQPLVVLLVVGAPSVPPVVNILVLKRAPALPILLAGVEMEMVPQWERPRLETLSLTTCRPEHGASEGRSGTVCATCLHPSRHRRWQILLPIAPATTMALRQIMTKSKRPHRERVQRKGPVQRLTTIKILMMSHLHWAREVSSSMGATTTMTTTPAVMAVRRRNAVRSSRREVVDPRSVKASSCQAI